MLRSVNNLLCCHVVADMLCTGELVTLLTLVNVLNYLKEQKVNITKVQYVLPNF